VEEQEVLHILSMCL